VTVSIGWSFRLISIRMVMRLARRKVNQVENWELIFRGTHFLQFYFSHSTSKIRDSYLILSHLT
jgi:hypothetical protein